MVDFRTRLESRLNRLFRISLKETTFTRRGFYCADAEKQAHLEGIGAAFVKGYNLALDPAGVPALCEELNTVHRERRGFAFEGAAMALALTNHLWRPQASRWRQLRERAGEHKYMLFVGYGWALARLPWLRNRPASVLSKFEYLEKWLILDGYGFHEGYFHPKQSIVAGRIPPALAGAEVKVFDQGLGRSIWFVSGADISRIARAVKGFPEYRRADIWSGIGLAATYAGGVARQQLLELRELAAGYEEHLAQGSAFAAQARIRAGLELPETGIATEVFCNCTAEATGEIVSGALNSITADQSSYEAYEQWRTSIRERFLDCGSSMDSVSGVHSQSSFAGDARQ